MVSVRVRASVWVRVKWLGLVLGLNNTVEIASPVEIQSDFLGRR